MIGERLGNYVIESELGSGGMGKVYLAEAPQERRRVAVKVLHQHLLESPEAVDRFKLEAEIGERVRHDNVVRTLDVGSAVVGDVTHHYLVMEYVEGQTLRDMLGEMGKVPEELCRHIGREVAKGLAAIHAAGVVHRDLKPENVLVTGDHVVKVMDLGVAKVLDEAIKLSQTGAFLGSVRYAAPELFSETPPDRGADFYSLGLILYELATGRHPFQSESGFAETLQRQLHEIARPAAELNPQLSPFFEEMCKALLEKDRAERLDFLPEDEESAWWQERAQAIRTATRRPLRRMRIPRETALYGRDAELAQLTTLFEQAAAGSGQVLLVEGEAGIGKTRLLDEFVGRLHARGREVNFLFGGYPPGGAAKGAGAFSHAYAQHFGTDGSVSYLEHSPALAPSFDAVLRGDTAQRPLSEDAMHACFVQATRALAAERTTIVLIDDLHFSTEAGRAVFAALAFAVPGHRVLLVGTARPGLPDEWTVNLQRLGHATRLELARLGPKDLMRLLEDSLGSKRVAEKLGHKIAVKSDGNPFFTFEIIRGLREERFLTRDEDGAWISTRAVDRIQIPSSVLDLIQARLADLDDADKELLDVASCCGFEFDPALVADALGLKRIPALRRFGNIERTHRLVRSSGRRLVFDHHQVQESLYGGLLEQLRVEYHAVLGAALEKRDARALEVCDHFLRGGLGERARPYLADALSRLEHDHANEAAVELADRALVCEDLLVDADRVAMLERKAARLDVLGRWAEEETVLRDAYDLADALGEPGPRTTVRRRLGLLYRSTDRYDEGMAVLAEAIELVRATGDQRTLGLVTGLRGDVLRRADQYDEARSHFEQHLAIATEMGDRRGEMMAAGAMGNILAVTGKRAEGVEWTRKYLALALELDDPRAQAIAFGNLGVDDLHVGRFDDAREHLGRSMTLSRELGYRMGEARAHGNLAVSCQSGGRFAEGIEHAERYLELSRELGYARGEVLAHNHLTELWLVCGNVDEARRHAGPGLERARQAGLRGCIGNALVAVGSVAEAEGNADEAAKRFAEAVAVGRETGNVETLLPALLAQGELREAASVAREANLLAPLVKAAATLGDTEEALAFLATSEAQLPHAIRMEARFRIFEATGDPAQLAAAKRVLAVLRANAPGSCRDSLLKNVALHREINSA